jgi:hypothetical protein
VLEGPTAPPHPANDANTQIGASLTPIASLSLIPIVARRSGIRGVYVEVRGDSRLCSMRSGLRVIVFGVVSVVIVVGVIVEPPGVVEGLGLAVVLVTMILLMLRERRKPS